MATERFSVNSSTITAPFLLHPCLKAKTLVKLEMLVVSEQLQYMDQMTVCWLRFGKARQKKKSQWLYIQAEVELHDGIASIGWLSGATCGRGDSSPGFGASSAPPNMTKPQMQICGLAPC